MTLAQFDQTLPDERSCWVYLFMRRWPDGRTARAVTTRSWYECAKRPWHWQCKKCGKDNRSPYRFSLKTKTIFEETKKPLLMWFKVLYLMLTSKKGISAPATHRMLGTGSYHSAGICACRLRPDEDPAFRHSMGIGKVDETYIGGRSRQPARGIKRAGQQRDAAGPRSSASHWLGKVGVMAL